MKLAPVYPIRSARLLLRPLTEADADDLVEYRSMPEVCRYVPFDPQSAEDVIERINGAWRQQELDQEGEAITLGAELVESGKLIGDLMVRWPERAAAPVAVSATNDRENLVQSCKKCNDRRGGETRWPRTHG